MIYDAIVQSLADDLGFECRKRDFQIINGNNNSYRYMFDAYELSMSSEKAKAQSPPIPNNATINPCYEIPLDYTVYLYIENGVLWIHTKLFKFDLSEPGSIEKIKAEFADLNRLRERIKHFVDEQLLYDRYGKSRNQLIDSLTKI